MHYKVGDRVVIKYRDEILKDRCYDGIYYPHPFDDGMFYMCGREYRISNVKLGYGGYYYHVEGEKWDITDDMISRLVSTYKVGDIVVIREWQDMVDEYGELTASDGCSCINTPHYIFDEEIKSSCGQCFRVNDVGIGHGHISVYSLDGFENLVFTNDMILGFAEVVQDDDIGEEAKSCVI